MEPAEEIPGGSAAYELRLVLHHGDVARIIGAKPSSVYRWGTSWGAIVSEPFLGRLRLTHELAFLLTGADPDLDVKEWFFTPLDAVGPSPGELISSGDAARVRQRLVTSARVRAGVATEQEIAAAALEVRRTESRADVARKAALQLLAVLGPLIRSGRFGVVRDERVFLVPADAVEQVKAVNPASLAVTERWLLGQGLAALGAKTYRGNNTVARRLNGRLTRVWDVPLELIQSEQ